MTHPPACHCPPSAPRPQAAPLPLRRPVSLGFAGPREGLGTKNHGCIQGPVPQGRHAVRGPWYPIHRPEKQIGWWSGRFGGPWLHTHTNPFSPQRRKSRYAELDFEVGPCALPQTPGRGWLSRRGGLGRGGGPCPRGGGPAVNRAGPGKAAPPRAERTAPLAPQKIMHTRKRHQDMFQDLNRKLQHAERDKEAPGPESKVQGRGACGVGRGEPGEGCLLPPPRPAPSSHLPGGGLPPPKLGRGGTSRRWARPRAPLASAMGGSEPGWGTARRGVLSRQAPPGAPCRPRQRPARPVEGPRAPPSRSPCPFRSSDCTRSPLPLRSCSHSLWAPGRPAAREAADAQPAAVGEPAPRPRDARLGAEGAGAAAPGAAGAAERGVGEGGRHHPAGGPGHHRPPDRGLSGRATEDGPQGGARALGRQPRRPGPGLSAGGQTGARRAGTRASRRDRRWPRPQWHRAPAGRRRLGLCPPRTQPRRAGGRRLRTMARPGAAGCPGTPAQAAATKDQPARPSRPGTVF